MWYLCKTVTASHTLLAPDSKICYSRGRDFLALQGQSVLQTPPDSLSTVWRDLGQQGQSCSAAAQKPRDGDVAQWHHTCEALSLKPIISHTKKINTNCFQFSSTPGKLHSQPELSNGNKPSLQLLLVPFSELERFPSASFPTGKPLRSRDCDWGGTNKRPGLSISAQQNSGAASASRLCPQPTRSRSLLWG